MNFANDMRTLKVHVIRTSCMGMVNYVYVGIDKNTKKAFVVDPAWNRGGIEQCLMEEGAQLEAILLTHSHRDHVNLADSMAKWHNCPVYMSREEASYYRYSCFNLQTFSDGEEIYIGDTKISCILTPGHTAGGTCYLADMGLFTGDTVFIEGCGLCKFEGGSADKMYDSFQRLKHSISNEVLIYPAHRYKNMVGMNMGNVKRNNIYMQLDRREDFVSFRNRPNPKGAFRFL